MTDREVGIVVCDLNGNYPEDFWGLTIRYDLDPHYAPDPKDDTLEVVAIEPGSV